MEVALLELEAVVAVLLQQAVGVQQLPLLCSLSIGSFDGKRVPDNLLHLHNYVHNCSWMGNFANLWHVIDRPTIVCWSVFGEQTND